MEICAKSRISSGKFVVQMSLAIGECLNIIQGCQTTSDGLIRNLHLVGIRNNNPSCNGAGFQFFFKVGPKLLLPLLLLGTETSAAR